MRLILTALVFVGLSVIAQSQELDNWLRPEWLKSPKLNESRPIWWYDVWLGKGVICVATTITDPQEIKDYRWHEVTTLSTGGQTSKVMLNSVELKVSKILAINQIVEAEGFTWQNPDTVSAFRIRDFSVKHGIWEKGIKIVSGQQYVVCVARYGLSIPGEYYIKWVMPVEAASGISEIVNASAKK